MTHRRLTTEGSGLEIMAEGGNKARLSRSLDPFNDIVVEPIKPKRAFEEVSAEIKRLIFTGQLRVGDKLPPESQLAGRFGVGRQTIREALRYLEMSGFIETAKGSSGGILVVDTVLNAMSRSMLDAFQLRRVSLHELVVARLEMDRVVLKYVLSSCNDEDIESLRQNVAAAKRRIENGKMAFQENLEFHRMLARASNNYVFVLIVQTMTTVMADFLSRRQSNLRIASRVVTEHGKLVEAIAERNESMAFEVLEKHFLGIEDELQIFQKRIGKGRTGPRP